MGVIELIILSAASGYVLVDVVQIGYLFKGLLKFKPFTCSICMSGWCALGFYFFPDLKFLGLMAVAMIASIILQSIIKKL